MSEIARLAFIDVNLLPAPERRDGLYAKVRALELAARSLGLLKDRTALEIKSSVSYEISDQPHAGYIHRQPGPLHDVHYDEPGTAEATRGIDDHLDEFGLAGGIDADHLFADCTNRILN